MDKKILINGKNNIDKINKVINPLRSCVINNPIDDSYYDSENQIKLLNQTYLNSTDKNISQMLNTKLTGYRAQDIEKKKFNQSEFITMNPLLEKLVASKLKCFYCKENILLCYKNVREKKQWTLDRIDNNLGHNTDNVLISCLECNLKRRCLDMNKYKDSKKFKNIKKLT